MSHAISINGRFLTQKISGVQRYAREIVRALDSFLDSDNTPLSCANWRLLAPVGTHCDLRLKHIKFETIGSGAGHLWEQVYLPRSPGLIVNLGNSGPVLRKNSMVVIHDVQVFRTPENFGARYALFHRLLGRALALNSMIGTVSEFSRRELSEVLKIPLDRIFVAPNGADHMRDIIADMTVLDRLAVPVNRYFLFVGSPTRNKNLPLAIEAFMRLNDPDAKLVVVGSLANTVFRDNVDLNKPGVILSGYLTDAEVSALYKSAAALVFPSLYEGFGIPPLEAMMNTCPVLASSISPVMEVCGDAADYFDPNDAGDLADLMRACLENPGRRASIVESGLKRAEQWTWQRSAVRLADAIAKRGSIR